MNPEQMIQEFLTALKANTSAQKELAAQVEELNRHLTDLKTKVITPGTNQNLGAAIGEAAFTAIRNYAQGKVTRRPK